MQPLPPLAPQFWGFGKAVVVWQSAKKAAKLYGLCDSWDSIMP